MKFRFVDKIIRWRPYQSITGLKAVSFEEYNLKEAFGGDAHLPESLLLESFLQLGNWLFWLSSDFAEMALVVRITSVQFHHGLMPGQTVRMEVTLERRHEHGYELAAAGTVNGQPIISGRGCLAVPVRAADFVDPESLRVLFSEIYQPDPTPPT